MTSDSRRAAPHREEGRTTAGFLERVAYRPRTLLLRRALFQVHLWIGIAVGLYIALIGLTGSILVFREEIDASRFPVEWRGLADAPRVPAGVVVAGLKDAYPDRRILSLTAPGPSSPAFVAVLGGIPWTTVACDPASGAVLGPMPPPVAWLDFLRRLHETLLVGRNGRAWNGVGAACLLLLAATGLVNWWPGARTWRRALTIDLRLNWRRINFDLHGATGFWSLVLLSCWAVTGVYFAWPEKISQVVESWSPLVSARPPVIAVEPTAGSTPPDLDALIARASSLDPGTTWQGVTFPSGRRAPLGIVMRRPQGEGRHYENTVYFDPYTGAHLATWRYGVNESLGDWLIWLQIPLHFGTSWGLTVKVIWACVGLALPLLAVTGLVMYWNRVLRHAWKRLVVTS